MIIDKLKEQLMQVVYQLPWKTHTISLLLDGINIENILHRFYNQNYSSQFEVLYLQTRLSELYEVSPCLVKIDSMNNPHFLDYINNLESEWGYILISDASWQKQIKHLRDLLIVKQPNSDKEVILKIADPLVAKTLFGLAEKNENCNFFGPFSQVCTTDLIDNEVNTYFRTNNEKTFLDLPYKLTIEQNIALDEVEIKRVNQSHFEHMQVHFPKFLEQYPTDEHKAVVNNIIKQSLHYGFSSPMEQTFFLNLYGYLGINVLQNYPDIESFVKQPTLESIRTASIFAEQKAIELAKGA